MSNQATATDAELILKLYDLRREAEMRKARHWWLTTFWPESVDDFVKIGMALGSQENNWMRQVGGYWEMAASLVLHGALNEDLFLEGSFSGEMFFIYAKVHPFLSELREKFQNPNMMGNIEKVINRSEKGRNTFKIIADRVAVLRETRKKEQAKKEAAA